MKILVVEDDLLVADALRNMLSRHNYAVEIARDGRAGLDCIEAFNYDLLLFDVALPKLDGISLCRHVRSRGYLMPILLLASNDSKHDRAVGLDAGADDYIVKTFDPEELPARIRALLRRGNDTSQPILSWQGLDLDPRNCKVTYQHQLLTLTPKEYTLLELFLRHSQRLFSCGTILEHLWAYDDAPSEEAVRTHIKGLRQKLKAAGAPHNLVETVYGIGYRLKSDRPSTPLAESGVVARGQKSHVVDTNSAVSSVAAISPSDTPQLLTAIWERYYHQTIERAELIERAIAALSAGTLITAARTEACQAAHTLAGALGTFGLPLGSQAAKQIELLLDVNLDLTPTQIDLLQSSVNDLRREIVSRARGTEGETNIATPKRDPVQEQLSFKVDANPTTQLLLIAQDPALMPMVQEATAGKFVTLCATELTSTQLAQPPDLIILDLDCFPQDTDAWAVLTDLERDHPTIPVLVLSHPNSEDDLSDTLDPTRRLQQRIEVARRGARMLLSKPISDRQISSAIDRVLQQAHVHQAKILIVDDDLLLLSGMKALLAPAGMTVTTLSEPNQFWDTLEACSPDLLILDLDMPIYNGIELCRAVRIDPQWATLPIMFVTAHPPAQAIDRVFAAGADDFIPKHAIASVLVARTINRLERSGLQRASIFDNRSSLG